MKKIAIWGWWQGNNLGDNWIKRTLSTAFPQAEFIDTTKMLFENWDFVICGGGGLFIRNVISPWNGNLDGISFGMIGLGAEFKHKDSKAIEVKKQSKFFYVRDQYSLDCMNIQDIERSYDVTFYKPLEIVEAENLNLDKLCFVWRDARYLVETYNDFYEYVNYVDNYDTYEYIIKSNFKEIIENDFQTSKDDIESTISDCGFIISGKYHGIVAAIQKGIPCIAIDICPKIRALMQECNLEQYCIKVNEVDKLDMLIKKAKSEFSDIRKKQYVYRSIANDKVVFDIQNAIKIIEEI